MRVLVDDRVMLFDALEARDLSELLRLAVLFVLIFGLPIGVTALHLHVKRWLQISSGEHDNPDRRSRPGGRDGTTLNRDRLANLPRID